MLKFIGTKSTWQLGSIFLCYAGVGLQISVMECASQTKQAKKWLRINDWARKQNKAEC